MRISCFSFSSAEEHNRSKSWAKILKVHCSYDVIKHNMRDLSKEIVIAKDRIRRERRYKIGLGIC
jgi:hypothetical protein